MGDAGKLRKGSFLIALGNPFNAARDGTPSASWGILSNVARRLDLDVDDFPVRALRSQQPPQQLPDPAPARRQAEPGHERRRGHQPEGRAGGHHHDGGEPAGFDAMAGYAIPMDKLGRRAVETLKEGKEIEYGLLGIKADNSMYQPRGRTSRPIRRPTGKLQITTRSSPSTTRRSSTSTRSSWRSTPTPRARRSGSRSAAATRRSSGTLILAKFPVEGEVIATNRPKPWRGLRVDYTTRSTNRTFGRHIFDAPVRGVVITEVEEGSPAAAAGLKKGQFISRGRRHRRFTRPRSFAQAVAGLDGPVMLETDLGPVTVK